MSECAYVLVNIHIAKERAQSRFTYLICVLFDYVIELHKQLAHRCTGPMRNMQGPDGIISCSQAGEEFSKITYKPYHQRRALRVAVHTGSTLRLGVVNAPVSSSARDLCQLMNTPSTGLRTCIVFVCVGRGRCIGLNEDSAFTVSGCGKFFFRGLCIHCSNPL